MATKAAATTTRGNHIKDKYK